MTKDELSALTDIEVGSPAWHAMVGFVADWIADTANHGFMEPSEIAQLWREKMS